MALVRPRRVLPSVPAGSANEVLNVLAPNIPWLLGGTTHLGLSNRTTLKFDSAGDFEQHLES
jgi:hypothetical protein